jgi:hypothetical protein
MAAQGSRKGTASDGNLQKRFWRVASFDRAVPAGEFPRSLQIAQRRAGKSLRGLLGLGLALLMLPLASPKERFTRETRIDIIRGLMKEIAVAKVALPRGRKGVRVGFPGKLDHSRAETELRNNGVAIKPGMPVEITKITFKSDEIIFEINGGGKRGKKWYQRIEVGMGTTTHPIAPETPVLAYGSWITLTFPENVPDLTVPQIKQALAAVLDFERHSPTVLYTPSVPPRIKEAIKNHQVIAGMDRDAVLSSKGPPDRRVREVREGVEQEDWIYGLPPHVLFVTFDGDTVVKVHQY